MVYSTRWFVLCLTLCYFVLVFFSPFSIAITSLWEERAHLSAFRTFVWFALVWICLFLLPLGVWEVLRFVIVALRELFSYPTFFLNNYGEIEIPFMMSYIHIAYNPKKVTCLEKGENISERKDNKSPQHKTMPISILWKYAILTLVSVVLLCIVSLRNAVVARYRCEIAGTKSVLNLIMILWL